MTRKISSEMNTRALADVLLVLNVVFLIAATASLKTLDTKEKTKTTISTELKQKNAELTSKIEKLKKFEALTKTPQTAKATVDEMANKYKDELFELRKFANDKIVIDLYFSDTGKIYFNEQNITITEAKKLPSFGFKYKISMQSTSASSASKQNYDQFCIEANKNGYSLQCN